MSDTIIVRRCRDGRCRKLSTDTMIRYYGKCYSCHSREFTNAGKIGLIEEIMTLIRHNIALRKESKNG